MIMLWCWLRGCWLIIMIMFCWWLWRWCWWYIYIYLLLVNSYILLAMTWWCKHVLKNVDVDYCDDLCEHMHCCCWVICSCIHYWWWQILYPLWRWLRCVCYIEGDDLVGDWYHMHVGVGLGALHHLTWVVIVYVFGDSCDWWWLHIWLILVIGELQACWICRWLRDDVHL